MDFLQNLKKQERSSFLIFFKDREFHLKCNQNLNKLNRFSVEVTEWKTRVIASRTLYHGPLKDDWETLLGQVIFQGKSNSIRCKFFWTFVLFWGLHLCADHEKKTRYAIVVTGELYYTNCKKTLVRYCWKTSISLAEKMLVFSPVWKSTSFFCQPPIQKRSKIFACELELFREIDCPLKVAIPPATFQGTWTMLLIIVDPQCGITVICHISKVITANWSKGSLWIPSRNLQLSGRGEFETDACWMQKHGRVHPLIKADLWRNQSVPWNWTFWSASHPASAQQP